MGSTKVTSGAYHESTMGLKKEVYSLASTRFNFVTVAAISLSWGVDTVVASLVVDWKSWIGRGWVMEGGRNASVAGHDDAMSSSSSSMNSGELTNDNIADCLVMCEIYWWDVHAVKMNA